MIAGLVAVGLSVPAQSTPLDSEPSPPPTEEAVWEFTLGADTPGPSSGLMGPMSSPTVGGAPQLQSWQYQGGYATTVATQGDITVTVSGPTGSTVRYVPSGLAATPDPDEEQDSVSVTTPETDYLTPEQDWAITAEHERVGRNAVTEAMRVGLSYDEAVETYADLLTDGQEVPTRQEAEAALQAQENGGRPSLSGS